MTRSLRSTLALLAALSVPAASLAAGGFSEEALATSVESLYGESTGPSAPGSEGSENPTFNACALIRDVERRWDELSPETQERLAPYILPPDEAPAGVPGAPSAAETEYVRAETEHFQLRYWVDGNHSVPSTDADGNGTPDYVEEAAGYLETAYSKETGEFGFAAPTTNPKIVVWFRRLFHNGLTHLRKGGDIWIELNCDIEAYTKDVLKGSYKPEIVSRDPAGPQAGLLKAVCAHELFHAVQAQYNWDTPTWWAEGTADYMGHAVFPESGFYLNNIGPHLQNPHVSLFRKGDFYDYSASIFPLFLSENAGGPQLIRQVWETVRSQPIFESLQTVMGDMEDTFLVFSAYNFLRNYQDSDRFPEVPRVTVNEVPSDIGPEANKGAEYYGANFFEYSGGQGTLKLSINLQNDVRLKAKVITIDGEGSWKVHDMTGESGLQVSVPGYGDQYPRVVVVVGNFTPDTQAQYSVSAQLE